jgi:hypothetical protein
LEFGAMTYPYDMGEYKRRFLAAMNELIGEPCRIDSQTGQPIQAERDRVIRALAAHGLILGEGVTLNFENNQWCVR